MVSCYPSFPDGCLILTYIAELRIFLSHNKLAKLRDFMKKLFTLFIFALLYLFSLSIASHGSAGSLSINEDKDRVIVFPDTKNYKTIVADLHTHSVFSDGHVWPNIRVEEALRDGLDALAITEHLEYQPHYQDIPHKDRNRSYEEAKAAASGKKIIIISGSEITRDMPPGHINAVFIKDANKLFNIDLPKNDKEKEILSEKIREMQWGADEETKKHYILANMWPAEKAVEAANQQGAFLFWNHPDWYRQAPDGIARLQLMHKKMIDKGYLHGIEVVNGNGYSAEAFQIAIDNNLAVIGTSDVHDLIDWDYKPYAGGHRPVTLVFARSKNANSIKQALEERRTVVWFKNRLIGLKENLIPLINSSLSTGSATYSDETTIARFTIKNSSDVTFLLKNLSDYSFNNSDDLVEIPAQGTKYVQVKTLEKVGVLNIGFEVLNALVGPNENAKINLKIRIN